MATKLKEVDAVVVGLGWTGGILSKELAEAGLKVVALERGAMRDTKREFALPGIRDELRYVRSATAVAMSIATAEGDMVAGNGRSIRGRNVGSAISANARLLI